MPNPRRGGLAALSLAMLLPSLGTSIANVALPSLRTAFGITSQDAQWVVIAYLVVVTATLVSAGRLGDLFGRRRLLLAGIGIFAVASLGAALAPQFWVLVAARAVQGTGAAIMMALTVAAVGDMVPRERTGSAVGLLGTVSAVGTALGPSVGGVLVASLGWPSVFAVMGLAGVAAFGFAWPLLPADPPERPASGGFDPAGTVLLVATISAFALATTLSPAGPANGWLAGAALLGLIGFAWVERRAAAPLVQLSLLREPGLGGGLLAIGLVSAILMATLVVGPFHLSGTLRLDPTSTGLVMSVGPTVAALVGVPAGRLVDRFGTALAVHAGLAGVLLGAVTMALLAPALGVAGYLGGLVPITAGYGLFQAANTTAVMGAAGPERRGVTSALLALARNLGLVTGASAMGTVYVLGQAGLPRFGLPAGGHAGLQLTFLVAAVIAALAMVAARGDPGRRAVRR